jgi:hypothetical protein
VRTAIGPEADVDHERHLDLVGQVQQILDRMDDAARVAEGGAPALNRIVEPRNIDQHSSNGGFGAHAAVARGNARHVRAVRAGRGLRLTFEQRGGRNTTLPGRDQSGVHLLLGELRAVVEASSDRWRSTRTSLVPDGEKSSLPLVVEEIRMREVEPANVDDPDQDTFATTVRGRAPDRPRQRGLRRLGRRSIELQGVDRMHERNGRVAFERIEHRDWHRRRHEVATQQ